MINCKSKTCCFTGHRKIPPENFAKISRRLENMPIHLYFGTGCNSPEEVPQHQKDAARLGGI